MQTILGSLLSVISGRAAGDSPLPEVETTMILEKRCKEEEAVLWERTQLPAQNSNAKKG